MRSDPESRTIADSLEETKERHRRYLRAINSPTRRRILMILKEGDSTIKELDLGLDEKTLRWHLDILEYGFCVTKDERGDGIYYKITEEGRVIDYLE
jgi:DNA-binding transcriptional ArsR family regulator